MESDTPPHEESILQRGWHDFVNQKGIAGLVIAALGVVFYPLLPEHCLISGPLCVELDSTTLLIARGLVSLLLSSAVVLVWYVMAAPIHQRDDLRKLAPTQRQLEINFTFTGRVAHEPDGVLSVLNITNNEETAEFKITANWTGLRYVPWIIPWSEGECSRVIIHEDNADLIIGSLFDQDNKVWRLDPFRCGKTTGNRKDLGTEAEVVLECHVDMTTADGHGRLFFEIGFYDNGTPIILMRPGE